MLRDIISNFSIQVLSHEAVLLAGADTSGAPCVSGVDDGGAWHTEVVGCGHIGTIVIHKCI